LLQLRVDGGYRRVLRTSSQEEGCNRYATDEPSRGLLPTRLARQRLTRVAGLICRSRTPGVASSSKKLVATR